jgi:hypothetical protein
MPPTKCQQQDHNQTNNLRITKFLNLGTAITNTKNDHNKGTK